MDMVSLLLNSDVNDKATKARKKVKGGEFVTREGLVIRAMEYSLLFFDDQAQRDVFIPYSQIMDFNFANGTKSYNIQLQDLEPDEEISVIIPKWLAKKEGLV